MTTPDCQPTVITRSDPGFIEVQWADGHRTRYTTAELRGLCPCAACVNELTGARMHDPRTVPSDLVHTDVRLVGNYGLALRFADGHETGIYPFRYLRDNDPAA